jgi:hypothetical protein
MASFWCLADCRNPECMGCDITKVPTDWLDQWIKSYQLSLAELLAERSRR